MAEDKKQSGWRANTVDTGGFSDFQRLCCCSVLPETSAGVLQAPTYLLRHGAPGTFDYCKACFKRADRLCSSKNLDQRITEKERNEGGHQNESLPRHFSSFGLPRTFFREWTEEGRSQVWFVPVSGVLEANHMIGSDATHLICMHSKCERGLSQISKPFELALSWPLIGG